jgi:galactose mutarotase-like enzyme
MQLLLLLLSWAVLGAAVAYFSSEVGAPPQGYPGELTVSVTYTLTHDNELTIEMVASTTETTLGECTMQPTPPSPVHHPMIAA